jgi:hypothetical protein
LVTASERLDAWRSGETKVFEMFTTVRPAAIALGLPAFTMAIARKAVHRPRSSGEPYGR